ncbi:HAD hydrolase-like protein [Sphingosinicella sp. BN140058]|uniref:HAD hydrolase-like protein n=1 Tax=Sphingosinicella sp. BN140058 TaxID=1892855 RepID=UPI001011C22A|nr:HAD hydrolase-like protein [Sphingosinicella sp. BN140058]QAY77735.1 HAD family hydrolase [Sphingosinicella sp. BN140058]
MYRLAIFDFDGTLADSAEWFLSSLNDVADRFGFRRVSDEEIAMLRHRSNREIVDYLGIKTWKLPLIARHMRAMVARDAERIRLFDGAAALLARLREGGVATALVTSNAEANARRILGSAATLIDHYACGSAFFGKAAKFRAVLRKAGIPAQAAIAIGDETRDIDAAREAGIAAGAVSWGYASAEALARFAPDHRFAGFDEIERLLLTPAG